jgi:hypothetical protein
MGSISNCCCTPPCSTCDESLSPALSSLEFSSPDGLHPISFSADLRGAKPVIPGNVASYSNVQNTYATNPAFPMNANNASCRFPGEGLSWINDSDTTDNIVPAFDSSCCWAGLAVPTAVAASAGKQHHYSESNAYDDIIEYYATYNGSCNTGTFLWFTDTSTHTHEQASTVYAKRFVFGVALRACWRLGPYGTPILRLSAKVFYKDYYNFYTHYYYKNTLVRVTNAWTRLDGTNIFGPICTSVPGSTSTSTICEYAAPGPGIPADSTIPDPIECLDCDSGTNPNTTNQPRLFPRNCTIETIERSIDIDTDTACSLVGTHTFPSSGPETIKYAAFHQCCHTGTSCLWKFPTQHGTEPCATCTFPAGSDVTTPYTSFGFTQLRAVRYGNYTPGTLRMDGDARVVMNWWTEPWTITINT